MKTMLNMALSALLAWLVASLVIGAEGPELKGPDRVTPGCLAVFEIAPPQEAAWAVAPTNGSSGAWLVDSAKARLVFASPRTGTYTIIAAVVVEGVPKTLTASLSNGSEDQEKKVEPNPGPVPESNLCQWVALQLPVLVKSPTFDKDKTAVAGVFTALVADIDRNSIRTPAFARTQMQVRLVSALAASGPTAAGDWQPFLGEFSKAFEDRLGEGIADLPTLRSTFADLAKVFQAVVTESAPASAAQEEKPAPVAVKKPTPASTVPVCTNGSCPVERR